MSDLFPEIEAMARPGLREPIQPEAMPLIIFGCVGKVVIDHQNSANAFVTGLVLHKDEPFEKQFNAALDEWVADYAPALVFFKDIIKTVFDGEMMEVRVR